MKTKQQLLAEFRALIDFVKELGVYTESVWMSPVTNGKWTVKDIVSHLMLWDQFYYNEAIHRITMNQALTMVNDLDVDDFNKKAGELNQSQPKEEIIKLTIANRNQLLHDLELIPEERYNNEYPAGDGSPFLIYEYVHDMIGHDNHHISQIKNLLRSIQ